MPLYRNDINKETLPQNHIFALQDIVMPFCGGVEGEIIIFATILIHVPMSTDFDIQEKGRGKTKVLVKYNGNEENVVIPTDVQEIGTKCFKKTKITTVSIPASVRKIRSEAFEDCHMLRRVTFEDPTVIVELGADVFDRCRSLEEISLPRVKKLHSTFRYTRFTSFKIGEYTTSLEHGSFCDCEFLKEIDLGSVETIGDYAFIRCAFESLIIPESVFYIHNNAIWQCEKFKEFIVNENNPHYKSADGVLYTKDGSELVSFPRGRIQENFTLPNTVKVIRKNAFYEAKIKNFVFNEVLEEIHDTAFEHAEIESFTPIPSSLKYVGKAAFYGVKADVVFPEGLTFKHNPFDYDTHTEKENVDDGDDSRPSGSIKMNNANSNSDRPAKGFDAIAGMESLKTMLRNRVIAVLKNPEMAKKYKLLPPNGMLLYGPPGCGKTFFAEKFAEETGFTFFLIKSSDIGTCLHHETERNIAELFKKAEKKRPSVICFDEFDALVPSRSSGNIQEFKSAEVNEFLSQLNNCSQRGIFVIGSTNHIENIDSAVLRTGRMDLKIEIGLPDEDSRKALFDLYLEGIPCSEDIDTKVLAQKSANLTASDIAGLVNEAANIAFLQNCDITQEIIETLLSSYQPSSANSRPKVGF